MFTLLLVVALGQSSNYIKDYDPEPGDRLVLAISDAKVPVPIGADYFAIKDFAKAIEAKDGVGIRKMITSGRGEAVDPDTPILFIKKHEEYKEADLAEVRILEGPYKDKAVYTFLTACRKLDPVMVAARERAEADARAWAVAKANRKPLDPKAITADLTAAIKKAKADIGKLSRYDAAQRKEKIMREAIDKVRRKHVAEMDELNAIATGAGVFINFDGQKYDVAGQKVKN